MAYATLDDVEKILPADIDMPSADEPSDERELKNLVGALEEATDLVIGYLGREFIGEPVDPPDDMVPDDVPGAVRRVVARIAVRGFLNDPANPGADSEVNLMGPFSHTVNWSKETQARDFFLTDSDKLRLERFRVAGEGSVAHMPMAGAGDWYATQ